MKKVSFEYSRESSDTSWYATNLQVTKTEAFTAYTDFVNDHAQNLQTLFLSAAVVQVEIYFNNEDYPQYEILYDAIQPEVTAYNSVNGITVTKTVSDV